MWMKSIENKTGEDTMKEKNEKQGEVWVVSGNDSTFNLARQVVIEKNNGHLIVPRYLSDKKMYEIIEASKKRQKEYCK